MAVERTTAFPYHELTWVLLRFKGTIHKNHETIDQLVPAIKALGCKYHVVNTPETNEELDHLLDFMARAYKNRTTVFYGDIYSANQYNQRVWSIPGSHLMELSPYCSHYYRVFKDEILNNDHTFLRAEDLFDHLVTMDFPDHPAMGVFCKPDTQMKFFDPGLFPKPLRWMLGESVVHQCQPDELVMVASPKIPFKEYRMLYVDGMVPTGSSYRQNGKRNVNPADPEKDGEVYEFAKYIGDKARDYQLDHPDEPPMVNRGVSFIDVCWYGGKLKLVEFSPFPSAGFYACDVPTIVKYVSESALTHAACETVPDAQIIYERNLAMMQQLPFLKRMANNILYRVPIT